MFARVPVPPRCDLSLPRPPVLLRFATNLVSPQAAPIPLLPRSAAIQVLLANVPPPGSAPDNRFADMLRTPRQGTSRKAFAATVDSAPIAPTCLSPTHPDKRPPIVQTRPRTIPHATSKSPDVLSTPP